LPLLMAIRPLFFLYFNNDLDEEMRAALAGVRTSQKC
jgi:hypothetical protein